MRFMYVCSVGLMLLSTGALQAQSSLAPLNPAYYHLLDRYEISQGQLSASFDTNVKPYTRQAIGVFLDTLAVPPSSGTDRFNRQYLAADNWVWTDSSLVQQRSPVLRYFYRYARDFFSAEAPGLLLSVSPVLDLQAGQDLGHGLIYTNTRGVEVEGTVDRKVGFYTYIGENQMLLPAYVDAYVRRTLTLPQEGFWKQFQGNGVDFLTARGHISFQATPHIGLQMGHGKHFVGNGYRSLVLSDFANNYLFLRINTQVWRLHYTNLYAKMTADVVGNPTGLYGTVDFPAKYFTFHRLGIHVTDRFNIGLFESIVHGDSTQRFEVEYLNPIVLYRGIEQQGGSTGNALMGLDMKWLLGRWVSVYGQAIIDEFVISEMRSGQNWWGNKYALQAGLKYINVLRIPHLDLQLEYNRVRPYTYAHEDLYRSYTHYEQALAHPLGANFKEVLGLLRYQPAPRWLVTARMIGAAYGADSSATNWGQNILLDNRTREQEHGNVLEQGVRTQWLMADLTASCHIWHNLFVDLRLIERRQQRAGITEQNRLVVVGLRLNAPTRSFDF